MMGSIRRVFVVVTLLSASAFGTAIMEVRPRGGAGNEITVTPGATVVVEVFISDVAPTRLQAYQATVPFEAVGGTLGSVTHDGILPVIDEKRPDFVFAGVSGTLTGANVGPPPVLLDLILDPADSVLVTDAKYAGEFTFLVSLDAVGDFTIDLIDIKFEGTALGNDTGGRIPFNTVAAVVHVPCVADGDCDDGLFCNGEETCVGGDCLAGSLPCPKPGLPLCDDDLDACVECLSPSHCDDGNECTSNLCTSGTCSNPPRSASTSCGDAADTDCTNPDTCDGAGNCLANDAPNNAPCDDGEFCTDGELCTDGVCGDGGPTDCSDAFPCTADTCNETADQCENDLIADNCLIGGECFSEGDGNPATECEVCDTSLSTSVWSFAVDGTGCAEDGNDCTADECLAGVCTHPNLPDGTECDDGNPCTGTGAPGVGVDTCDGAGNCAGLVDLDCSDDCPNAVEVFDGENEGSNVGFGPDLVEAGCQPNSNHDAWFKYTAPCGGEVLLTTHGSVFAPSNDTVLSVFDACGGSEIACDDDGGDELLSALTFLATANVTYFIRVAGWDVNQGAIVLNIRRLDTCLIDTVCHPEGTVNPDNECEVCLALLSNTDWSAELAGVPCGDPSLGECDNPDACDGLGTCEPNHKPDETPCSEDGNECTDDICLDGICSNPHEAPGFPCGDPADTECDNPDTCDGAGACRDNLEPPRFACGEPTDTDCDNPDTCDGAGVCLQNLEPDDTVCTDDGNDCTEDVCEAALCIHPDKPLGAACGDSADTQCDDPDTCDGFGTCEFNHEPNGLLCDDVNICTGPDLCLDGACDAPFIPEPPIVETGGPRLLIVTPQPVDSTIPQALLVTSPDHPCVAKYVGATGELGDTPVFQSPMDWGTVIVFGTALVPDSTYNVAGECGGGLSGIGTATTAIWADVVIDGRVNIFDFLCVLTAFSGNFSTCILLNADLHPCTPDGTIRIFDLLAVLNAFAGAEFPCAAPCAGGACCEDSTCTTNATASECMTAGGVYHGDGIDCVPNPCGSGTLPSSAGAALDAGGAGGEPTLTVVPVQANGRAGSIFTVHLFASGLADLRAYELSVDVVGGRRGRLEPYGMFIDTARGDYVFAELQSFNAVDGAHIRMINGLLHAGVPTVDEAYLGSFEFRATRDARGTFGIVLRANGGVHLVDSSGREIDVHMVDAVITVGPDAVRDGKALIGGR